MKTECQQPHARWLAAAVIGEEDVPLEERASLDACPICSAELAGLREMQRVLDAGRAREEAMLELTEREAGDEEEHRVRRAYDSMRAKGDPPRRMDFAWVAAAIVLIAGLVILATSRDPDAEIEADPSCEKVLDEANGGLQLISPRESDASFAALVWRDAESANRTYAVEVWSMPEEGEPELLYEEDDIRGTRLDLDKPVTDAWTETIEWTLRARGPDRNWIPGAEAAQLATRSER